MDILGHAIQLLIPHYDKERALLCESESVQCIFRVLCIWISINASDFLSPELSALLPTLTDMIGSDDAETIGEEIHSKSSMSMAEGEKDYLQIFKRKLFQSNLVAKEPASFPSSDSSMSSRVKAIRYLQQIQWNLMISLNEEFISNVAVTLLSMSQRIQRKIPADDLASYPLSYKVNAQCQNVKEYTEFLNDLCRWIEILVLSSPDPAERAKIVTFFIFLMDKSKDLRSYSVCMGVYMGLTSSPIQRSIL